MSTRKTKTLNSKYRRSLARIEKWKRHCLRMLYNMEMYGEHFDGKSFDEIMKMSVTT